jgi:hypothetical protein
MAVKNVADRMGANSAVAQIKRRYTQPVLTRYGSVKTLTAAGTAGDFEQPNPGTSTGCSMDNSRKDCRMQSERSTKQNIVYVGRHPLGIGLYLFEYKSAYRKWGYGRQFGVMVDEVERVMPEAVSAHPDGYKLVNYAMLGVVQARQNVPTL